MPRKTRIQPFPTKTRTDLVPLASRPYVVFMKPEHATFIRRLLDNELAADEQVLSSAQDGVWRAKPASKPKTIAEKKRAAEALASATQWLDECKAKHRLTQDTIAAFEKMVKG